LKRKKSGKDITDGLYRQIERAEKDIEKLTSDLDFGLIARNALRILRDTTRLLHGVIGAIPSPERPGKPKLPDEPQLMS
jgi:hypothetical protein